MATKRNKAESELVKKLRKESEGLTGFDKALLENLLAEYDALASFTESLRHGIEEHGVMIEKEVGSVNNRHMELVENPEFTTYQKAIGRQGDLAKKLSDFNKRSEGDKVEEDSGDLLKWNREH